MGILYPFCLLHSEFDKNANSACKRQGDLVISSWFSDLGFAFFVRWLRSAHFLILAEDYMKFGVRKPSIKRSISARTTGKLKRTVNRTINPLYGKKGMGYINNPKKAVYNKVYNKTTIGVRDIVDSPKSKSSISVRISFIITSTLCYGIPFTIKS